MEKASAPVSDNSDGGKFYKMRRGSLTTFSVLHHCPIKQVLCDEGKFSIFALNGDTVDHFECFVKSVSSYRLICVKGLIESVSVCRKLRRIRSLGWERYFVQLLQLIG